MYQNGDFKGWDVNLPEGSFDLVEIIKMGGNNDDASSIVVMPGYEAILFKNNNFHAGVFSSGIYNINEFKKKVKNDDVSSIIEKINRRFEISDPNF